MNINTGPGVRGPGCRLDGQPGKTTPDGPASMDDRPPSRSVQPAGEPFEAR
ncbi:hypothetical protein HSBGL_0042 [Halapricum desulfuricans]|nr:hypothetical protein HSBGL_0042 [Halapricum desulfuricans]